MCLVYHNKKNGDFVRLCYVHKGRRGEHIPVVAGFTLSGAHFSFRRDGPSIRGPAAGDTTRPPRLRRAVHLTFRLPNRTEECVAGSIESMCRWAHAQAEWKGDLVTLHPQTRWANTQPIIDRARSFGWLLQEGATPEQPPSSTGEVTG